MKKLARIGLVLLVAGLVVLGATSAWAATPNQLATPTQQPVLTATPGPAETATSAPAATATDIPSGPPTPTEPPHATTTPVPPPLSETPLPTPTPVVVPSNTAAPPATQVVSTPTEAPHATTTPVPTTPVPPTSTSTSAPPSATVTSVPPIFTATASNTPPPGASLTFTPTATVTLPPGVTATATFTPSATAGLAPETGGGGFDPLAPIFGVDGSPYQPRLVSMEKILESGFIGCGALLMGGLIVGTLAAVWLENKRVAKVARRRRRRP